MDLPQLNMADMSSSYMDTTMNFALTYNELLFYYGMNDLTYTYQEWIEADGEDSENGNVTSSFNPYQPVDSNTSLSSQSFTYDSSTNEEEINPTYSDQDEFGDANVSSSFNPYQPVHPDTSLFPQLSTYDLTPNEEINLPYTDQEDFGDASATPSFNPQHLTDIDVSSFPQSPTYISSVNTTPIPISSSSSDSTSTSSTLQYACSSYSEENFSDNITDNEYLSEGDDEVFSIVENACTRCGTDMGEMNPRQLCGKVYCLIYD